MQLGGPAERRMQALDSPARCALPAAPYVPHLGARLAVLSILAGLAQPLAVSVAR
jgi:hypothetical protein